MNDAGILRYHEVYIYFGRLCENAFFLSWEREGCLIKEGYKIFFFQSNQPLIKLVWISE